MVLGSNLRHLGGQWWCSTCSNLSLLGFIGGVVHGHGFE
jgi:hypothetical protein